MILIKSSICTGAPCILLWNYKYRSSNIDSILSVYFISRIFTERFRDSRKSEKYKSKQNFCESTCRKLSQKENLFSCSTRAPGHQNCVKLTPRPCALKEFSSNFQIHGFKQLKLPERTCLRIPKNGH